VTKGNRVIFMFHWLLVDPQRASSRRRKCAHLIVHAHISLQVKQ